MSNPGDEEATLGAPPARAKPESLLGQPTGGAHIELVLTQGPGAWLYKGKDERGRRSLIQIVPLRPCDPEEVRARDDLLRQVAAATALLGQDPEVKVESHGFDPDLGLGGCFYWLLQWTGAAERIGQTSLKDGPALVAAAMALLDRVASRHARGRLDPLLHAAFVVPRTGGADLVGAPIAIPKSWVSLGAEPPERAPEERSIEEARRSGDLWRLGHALKTLSEGLEVPEGFEDWLDRLIDPDPGHRFSTADEAASALEALGAAPRQEAPEALRRNAAAETLIDQEAAPRAATDPSDATLADVPRAEMDEPSLDPSIDRRAGADEAPTMWMKRADVAGAPPASSSDASPAGPKATVVGVSVGDAQAMGPKGTLVGVRLGNEADGVIGESGRAPPTRVFDEAARASAPPNNPQPTPGAFGPGGTVANEPVPALGPGGTLAAEIPPYGGALPMPVPYSAPAPASYRPPASSSSAPPAAAPASSGYVASEDLVVPPAPGRIWLTLALLFLLAIAAAAVVQLLKPPKASTDLATGTLTPEPKSDGLHRVTPWNDVLLEAVPSSAEVVSERDGRLLGSSPIRLLVPAEEETVVLITAEGYEPVRLTLPTRGRITVHLTSLGGVTKCPVDVNAPGTKPLEIVGMKLGSEEGSWEIPGAVVMRSPEGHGAWLVRCSTYGGQKRHRFVSRARPGTIDLRVARPDAAEISVDGVTLGKVPATGQIPSGMALVKATLADGSKVSRWVPAFADMQVELPRPIPSKK